MWALYWATAVAIPWVSAAVTTSLSTEQSIEAGVPPTAVLSLVRPIGQGTSTLMPPPAGGTGAQLALTVKVGMPCRVGLRGGNGAGQSPPAPLPFFRQNQ